MKIIGGAILVAALVVVVITLMTWASMFAWNQTGIDTLANLSFWQTFWLNFAIGIPAGGAATGASNAR